uniref:Uncharacterized protein n=1 Tax=Phenylobacterium glaciei TaxID=2803784 RepID=A0A974S726_9CAUL|nr:hypothetical protein JKL49_18735 [Phenylobacterium glaciei]
MELTAPALVVNSSTAMLFAIERGAGIGAIPTAILRTTSNLVMLDIPRWRPAPCGCAITATP